MQSITTRNGETEITHGNEMISVKAPKINLENVLETSRESDKHSPIPESTACLN